SGTSYGETAYSVDASGCFDIQSPDTEMAPGQNLYLRAVAASYYDSGYISNEVYYSNPTWGYASVAACHPAPPNSSNADISLTPPGGGGGGNQGQGGSG